MSNVKLYQNGASIYLSGNFLVLFFTGATMGVGPPCCDETGNVASEDE
jgi:hypothetical protein